MHLEKLDEIDDFVCRKTNAPVEIHVSPMKPTTGSETTNEQGIGVVLPVLICMLLSEYINDAPADFGRNTRRRPSNVDLAYRGRLWLRILYIASGRRSN